VAGGGCGYGRGVTGSRAALAALTCLLAVPAPARAVEALSPPDGARVEPAPTLTWRLDAGESAVRVVVYRDAGEASGVAFERALAADQTSVTVDPPLPAGRYVWEVEARRLVLATASGPRRFVVDPAGGGVPDSPPPPDRDAEPRRRGFCEARPRLRCPDLRMARPSDLWLDRRTRRGRALLRARNSIDSVGRGPVEVRGRRSGALEMKTSQRIYRRGGGHVDVRTGGELYFYFIPGQGRYWKYADPARFELWRLDRRGRRVARVRRGPKQHYCLRDLQRRHPRLRGSPRSPVYPACSQDGRRRRVTLGTSVGWSDVYPSGYHEQWIDVTGLSGCFAYRHIADPRNTIRESNERNNVADRIVRLPWGRPADVCRRRARGR
jgi:hypothetical protein